MSPVIQVWLAVVLDWHRRWVVSIVWQWNPCAYSRSQEVSVSNGWSWYPYVHSGAW